MRTTIAALSIVAVFASTTASAQVYVKPHIRSDGTYVQGHVRSRPNNTTVDNWSTRPNVNPYTGREGSADPYPTYPRTRPYSTPSQPTPRAPKPLYGGYGIFDDD